MQNWFMLGQEDFEEIEKVMEDLTQRQLALEKKATEERAPEMNTETAEANAELAEMDRERRGGDLRQAEVVKEDSKKDRLEREEYREKSVEGSELEKEMKREESQGEDRQGQEERSSRSRGEEQGQAGGSREGKGVEREEERGDGQEFERSEMKQEEGNNEGNEGCDGYENEYPENGEGEGEYYPSTDGYYEGAYTEQRPYEPISRYNQTNQMYGQVGYYQDLRGVPRAMQYQQSSYTDPRLYVDPRTFQATPVVPNYYVGGMAVRNPGYVWPGAGYSGQRGYIQRGYPYTDYSQQGGYGYGGYPAMQGRNQFSEYYSQYGQYAQYSQEASGFEEPVEPSSGQFHNCDSAEVEGEYQSYYKKVPEVLIEELSHDTQESEAGREEETDMAQPQEREEQEENERVEQEENERDQEENNGNAEEQRSERSQSRVPSEEKGGKQGEDEEEKRSVEMSPERIAKAMEAEGQEKQSGKKAPKVVERIKRWDISCIEKLREERRERRVAELFEGLAYGERGQSVGPERLNMSLIETKIRRFEKKINSVLELAGTESRLDLEGFNEKRQDFEVEYDRDAELLISEMEFNGRICSRRLRRLEGVRFQ
jgi:hypothetical protein